MKAAVLITPGVLEIQEVPRPVLGAHEVRIKVARAGICGSDVNIFQGGLSWAQMPLILGHEISGVIAEVGPEASFRVGQSVAVMPVVSCGVCSLCLQQQAWRCKGLKLYGVHMPGAYADEIVVTDHRVHILPDNMSMDEGAIVEPLAVVMHVLNRANMQPEDSVAILGSGSIGLLTIQELVARKSQFIMATGRVDKKLNLAKNLGANLVINDTREDVVQKGLEVVPDAFDVILDFVCSQKTIAQAIALGKPGTRIIMIAAPHSDHKLSIDYTTVYRKEMTLLAARLYSDEEFKQALSVLAKGKINVAPVITARYKLNEASQAMDFVINNRKEAIKVFIEP